MLSHAAEPPAPPADVAASEALRADLRAVSDDLARLQSLLSDASESLLRHFSAASHELAGLPGALAGHPGVDAAPLERAMAHVGGAVTALQFQDMASQLIAHAAKRLTHCADQLDLHDAVVAAPVTPLRNNPVTQAEMDPGSIELF